ncbi:heterokaryon incompatibility protein-domain-containing protein [Phaeosphaeria sp. MPI-PUGE-AT-0046c]|nr:heterokaryon incompatibility protein-domain-containing protein [Phaeosphaeria sp. MPI-PUGE-AT-0046c]
MFCDVCLGVLQRHENRQIERQSEQRTMSFGHHRNRSDLMLAAESGCYVCVVVWRTVSELPPAFLYTEKMEEELIRHGCKQDTLPNEDILVNLGDNCYTHAELCRHRSRSDYFELRIRYGQWNLHRTTRTPGEQVLVGQFSLSRLAASDATGDLGLSGSGASQDTLSEQALQHAERWLKNCCDSHATCSDEKTMADMWYPTRLLYIDSAKDERYRVRLIHTAQERPTGNYFTLSHTWGRLQFKQLTRDTILEFTRGIPLSDLPTTFYEAIFVTKRLGVQHLWIDSLCIMQDKDDLSDWSHEASLMHKVYSHSHCNISASVSVDGSQGLSRKRDPAKLYRPRVSLNMDGFDTDVDGEYLNHELSDNWLWENRVTGNHLNKRGWVFQERLLAPRILHFSHDQVFWECRETRACEVYPGGHHSLRRADCPIAKFKSYFRGGTLTELSTSHSATDLEPYNKEDYHNLWRRMVESYSSTQLTNPLDKLVALSGVAKVVSTFLGATYVAGMWRETLAEDLCWSNPVHVTTETTWSYSSLYRAPTWSWASTDYSVVFLRAQDTRFTLDVKDVCVQYGTNDTTGLVAGGWIDVAGPLGPITLSLKKGQDNLPGHVLWRIDIDKTCTEPQPDFIVMLNVRTSDSRRFEHDNVAGRLFFMPCATRRGMGSNFGMNALVLRVVEPDGGIFERVGMAYALRVGGLGDGQNPRVPTDVDEEIKARLPCLRYENGIHTIRII